MLLESPCKETMDQSIEDAYHVVDNFSNDQCSLDKWLYRYLEISELVYHSSPTILASKACCKYIINKHYLY
jgi:hypothetical protein